MGRHGRRQPIRLADKLFAIRETLELSQTQLGEKLGDDQFPLYKADISNFESGKREPSLIVLLRYARLAGVLLDVLVDDEIDLPDQGSQRSPRRK